MDDGDGLDLTASMRAAWGFSDRPAKGPKPGLSLEQIVTAAVRIADQDGLAAVSMSKVAAEVGVTAMALYRYVGNKDELLTLMVDAAFGIPPELPRPGQTWKEGLTEWVWAEVSAYRRHPWGLRLPIAGMPALPNQITWLDRGLRCLADSGLSESDKLSSILLISNLARSYSAIEQDLLAAFAAVPSDQMVAMAAGYTRLMRSLADPERFPALNQALASGALDTADPMDKELLFGLERALDGIETLIKRTAPQ